MANSWFQFKQFKIEQDRCAMKVGTDGVLLGAWAKAENPIQILDVGSGTGLIALMLAQRYPKAFITGIEIEPEASEQAHENAKNSPFAKQICIKHQSYQDFTKYSNKPFDLIVSNPPYFKNSYNSDSHKRNLARHTDTLSYTELIELSYKNLNNNGLLSVIIPFFEYDTFVGIASENNLFLNHLLKIYPTKTSLCKRVLLSFSKKQTSEIKTEEMILEPYKRHEYSEAYKQLTKGFYLWAED